MDTYFKNGFEDDDRSEGSDEDDDILDDEIDASGQPEDSKRDGLYGATDEQIEQEAARMLESL